MQDPESSIARVSPEVVELLERKFVQFNTPDFIPLDPISIPHRFSRKQDIEVAGLFAAIFAWGQRKTIVAKGLELMERMDFAPYEFVKNHEPDDLIRLQTFKHRTFNATDLLYFVSFLKSHYSRFESLEDAFLPPCPPGKVCETVESGLTRFHDYFCESEFFPSRTRKHLATPARNSSCKRLNMFLRWMVRQDDRGIDFGLWKRILPSQLVCPCDVHVERVARKLGLIQRTTVDWGLAMELTRTLRLLDRDDPVKYDFALFGLGVQGAF